MEEPKEVEVDQAEEVKDEPTDVKEPVEVEAAEPEPTPEVVKPEESLKVEEVEEAEPVIEVEEIAEPEVQVENPPPAEPTEFVNAEPPTEPQPIDDIPVLEKKAEPELAVEFVEEAVPE